MTEKENELNANVPAPIAATDVGHGSDPIPPADGGADNCALPLARSDGEVDGDRVHVHDYVETDESMRGGFASVEGVHVKQSSRLLWIIVAVMSLVAVLSGVCSALLTAHFMRRGERPPIISTVGESDRNIAAVVSARKSMIVEVDCGGSKGSGIIMKRSGGVVYILTNAHVLSNALSDNVAVKRDPAVRFYGEENYFKANVIGYASYYDIAVLALSHDTLYTVYDLDGSDYFDPCLQYAEGATVVSLGNAMGMGIAAYDGIISRASELIDADNILGYDGKKKMPVIRTTAVINAGMSGGALFDMQGHLVGVGVYRMATSSGVDNAAGDNPIDVEDTGFVLPVSIVYPVYRRILAENSGGGEVGLLSLSLSEPSTTALGRISLLGFSCEFRGGKLVVCALDSVNLATSLQIGDEITAIGDRAVTPDICRTVGALLSYHGSGGGSVLKLSLKRGVGTATATFDKYRYAI